MACKPVTPRPFSQNFSDLWCKCRGTARQLADLWTHIPHRPKRVMCAFPFRGSCLLHACPMFPASTISSKPAKILSDVCISTNSRLCMLQIHDGRTSTTQERLAHWKKAYIRSGNANHFSNLIGLRNHQFYYICKVPWVAEKILSHEIWKEHNQKVPENSLHNLIRLVARVWQNWAGISFQYLLVRRVCWCTLNFMNNSSEHKSQIPTSGSIVQLFPASQESWPHKLICHWRWALAKEWHCKRE